MKKSRSLEKSNNVLDATRGTAIWGFNQFREDALVQLMIDLLDKESCGLDREQGELVAKSLEKVSIYLSTVPDRFWIRSSIMGAFDKFKNLFLKWNEINGADKKTLKSRRNALKKMRKARHKLATVVRKNMFILSKALDLKLIEDIYEALGALPKTFPKIFLNLAKALTRFQKKK